MRAQTLTLQRSIVIEPEADGSFHAYCPAITRLHASGSTAPEAMTQVKDAIVGHLLSLVPPGELLPSCSVRDEPVPGGGPGLRSAVFQFG